MFSGKKSLVLGVSGGIAAYKACEIARHFVHLDVSVYTVLTENASKFVTPLTFESLTGLPCLTGMFDDKWLVEPSGRFVHLDLGRDRDAFLVAPATANVIAKFASGIADDLLSTAYLSASCPKIVAPAMNPVMWEHPATVRNVARLEKDGVTIIQPGKGDVACGDFGSGRLAEVSRITDEVERALGRDGPWKGRKVLVTTGPTREAIDPVRFVSNSSTGDFGRAVARQLVHYGAEVSLIEANPTGLTDERGMFEHSVTVSSASEMLEAVLELARASDWVFMLSAVADYASSEPSREKIKKEGKDRLTLELSRTLDVITELQSLEKRPRIIGVSAESTDVVAGSLEKLERKGIDAILAVDIGGENPPFGDVPLEGTLIKKGGDKIRFESAGKAEIAVMLVNALA